MRREAPLYGLVAVDVQHSPRPLLIGAVAVDEARGKPVIHVIVGHEQRMNASQAQIVRQRMIIGIRREIDEQFAIDEHLRARAYLSPALCARVLADGAGAKRRRQAFCRRGAEVEYLHNSSS